MSHLPQTLPYDNIRLEGGLFVPDLLERAAQGRGEHQAAADYRIPKGTQLHDEYGRAFKIARAQWKEFAATIARSDISQNEMAQRTRAFTLEFLRDVLGYDDITASHGVDIDAHHYPIAFLAADARIPVVVAPATQALTVPDECFAVTGGSARRKSPIQLMQDVLNASKDHTWGLVTNGSSLRLLHDSATLTRPCYLEVDLEAILRDDIYHEFKAVWLLLHASRALPVKDSDCVWEGWRKSGHAEGIRVRDGLRKGVTDSLLALGGGFLQHKANAALRQALDDGTLTRRAYFEQLLRLVYRFIFLFTTEERGILHPDDDSPAGAAARALYAEGYAMRRLSQRALRQHGFDDYHDLWQGIQIVVRSLRAGQPRLALPALGGLFAGDQCPDLDACLLTNRVVLTVMRNLRWAEIQGALTRVDYRNMGPEELGSVYESLLELEPEVDVTMRAFTFIGLEDDASTAGNKRKTTGSYYTPDSLVQELIKSALDPVIEDKTVEAGRMASCEWRMVRGEQTASDSSGVVSGSYRKVFAEYANQRLSRSGSVAENSDAEIADLWKQTPFAIRHSLFAAHALLQVSVIDPACGSGHFLLSAARRLAEKLAPLRSTDGAVHDEDYRVALRDVVSHCIYGVDRNPLALELARTALWLEGFEPGRPLSFLDHHLVCGDALLGVLDFEQLRNGIPKDAYQMLSGDDRQVCTDLTRINTAQLKALKAALKGEKQLFEQEEREDIFKQMAHLDALPDDTPADITAKAQAYTAFLNAARDSHLAHAADLFVGAFLVPKDKSAATTVPTTEALQYELTGSGKAATPEMRSAVNDACRRARVLHWPLAFAHVFARGGFDCVLGNPPWERIKLQEQEFFATRVPKIAEAKNKAERSKRIAWLSEGILASNLNPDAYSGTSVSEAEKRDYKAFIIEKRLAEALSVFAHLSGDDGGRFPLTGTGDVNTYALFAETMVGLIADNGRSGFIVPTGIATDDSTKQFFVSLIDQQQLDSLISFYEVRLWFKSTDERKPFCLLTIGNSQHPRFLFDAYTIEDLSKEQKWFALKRDDFIALNPNTRTLPTFRSQMDTELTRKICRNVPVLIREAREDQPEANPWGIRFSAMFHMSNDSHLFVDSEQVPQSPISNQQSKIQNLLPLYEAKMIHQFDHRWATYRFDDDKESTVDVSPAQKQTPDYAVRPRYYVEARHVLARIADVPSSFAKAYAAEDMTGLLIALANWIQASEGDDKAGAPIPYDRQLTLLSSGNEQLGLFGSKREPVTKRYPILSENADGVKLPKEWMDTKVLSNAGTCLLAADELKQIQHSNDLGQLADTLMDARSPTWLLGFRDITNAAAERTVISSVMPRVAVGNKIPLLMLPASADCRMNAALAGNLNTLCLDFVARQKVSGTTLNFFIVKQLPVLPPDRYNEADLAFITPRVLELTYTTHDLKPWAEALVGDENGEWRMVNGREWGGEPFAFDPDRRARLRAELDAYYARLYGLTRDDLRYILDPADVMGPDYPSETFRVLKNNDIKTHGEYRTQRLVLEAWDALAAGGEYRSPLCPPPGERSSKTKSLALDPRFPRGPLYAFSHGIEKSEREVTVMLDAVPCVQLDRLPRTNEPVYPLLAELRTFYVEATLSHDAFDELMDRQEVPFEGTWWRLELSNSGPMSARVFGTDDDTDLGAASAVLTPLSSNVSGEIQSKVRLPFASKPEEIEQLFPRRSRSRGTFLAVYNVGQGLASAICETKTSAPLMYFDFGCGCYQNAHTRPTSMRFCFSYKPPIILSHWHFDHYMAARLLDPRALESKWLVPQQNVGPSAVKFASQLWLKGNIHVWPGGTSSIPTRWGHIVQCTGMTLNTSGLAMLLNLRGAKGRPELYTALLAGDAGYDDIPGIADVDFDGLVVSHHGGRASGTIPHPRTPTSQHVLSYGTNNSYKHGMKPSSTRQAIATAGWNLGFETPAGHVGMGLNGVLPTLGCTGSKCDLAIVQY